MSLFKIAVSPGRILREEYLEPLGLSAGGLARALDVPRTRIERIVNEQTAVSVDTALRLAAYFRTTPQFWLNLQNNYDLARAAPARGIAPHPAVSGAA
ncbi:MAG: HigA family addiction module antitoxin [Parvularculaceae bacterium]